MAQKHPTKIYDLKGQYGTHRMSSRADREAPWAPDASSHCPRAAEHTPAYCPGTEMSAAAAREKRDLSLLQSTFSTTVTLIMMNEWVMDPLIVYFTVQLSKN